MSNLYNTIKNLLDGKKTKPKVETEIIKTETTVSLTPFEEKLNYLYMGCYNDNPVQPIIPTELENVRNQLACINAGQKAEYKYVALQNGNECLATNDLDFKNMISVPRQNCNMVCDETSAGYCGGVLKNQIYATSLIGAVDNGHIDSVLVSTNSITSTTPTTPAPPTVPATPTISTTTTTTTPTIAMNSATTISPTNNKESFKHLENFASHNKEMNLINKNISQIDMMCEEPINKYNLFLSLLIVLLLLHVLAEYIYKK